MVGLDLDEVIKQLTAEIDRLRTTVNVLEGLRNSRMIATLPQRGKGTQKEAITGILQEAKSPLSPSEITKRLKEHGIDIKAASIRSVLSLHRDKGFANTGDGWTLTSLLGSNK